MVLTYIRHTVFECKCVFIGLCKVLNKPAFMPKHCLSEHSSRRTIFKWTTASGSYFIPALWAARANLTLRGIHAEKCEYQTLLCVHNNTHLADLISQADDLQYIWQLLRSWLRIVSDLMMRNKTLGLNWWHFIDTLNCLNNTSEKKIVFTCHNSIYCKTCSCCCRLHPWLEWNLMFHWQLR